MKTDDDILKVISNETIDSVKKINIVTPSIYKSFFEKHASSHGTALDDEEKMTDRLLDSKIQMCDVVQEKNSSNVIRLSDNTAKAIHAIRDKDDSTLNQILVETNALRLEIEKLKEAVYKDELTNVYNRKWMNDKYLDEENKFFTEDGTLAIIDLNYFKIINDTFGHVVGDKVLVFIANKLKQSREKVVRYGGDEFILLFSSKITKDLALSKLNDIREDVLLKKLKTNNTAFRTSFSFGAYEYKSGEALSEVLEKADQNMYDDKKAIKERITGIG